VGDNNEVHDNEIRCDNMYCMWLRIGTSVRLVQHGNEPSGCMKDKSFLDWLSEC
jgi:hypothetical protein